jgi:hypothetical protein
MSYAGTSAAGVAHM